MVGPHGKFAVQCDGEKWEGAEIFKRELQAQENLAKAGWEFFRITESKFYADEHALDKLWPKLEKLNAELDPSQSKAEGISNYAELNKSVILERLDIIDKTSKKRKRNTDKKS